MMSVEQPSQPSVPGETSPDYIRGYRAGIAKGSPAEISRTVPFKRWFIVLFIGTLLTIILPLFADSKDTFVQTNSITTFTEVNGDMQPTSAKIWVDGRTYALLSGRSWLYLSTGVVLLEAIVLLVSGVIHRMK